MNGKNSITVDVNCNLSVSRETAEGCMKLLELFLSANQQFRVHEDRDDDGKVMLSLFDLNACEAQP